MLKYILVWTTAMLMAVTVTSALPERRKPNVLATFPAEVFVDPGRPNSEKLCIHFIGFQSQLTTIHVSIKDTNSMSESFRPINAEFKAYGNLNFIFFLIKRIVCFEKKINILKIRRSKL